MWTKVQYVNGVDGKTVAIRVEENDMTHFIPLDEGNMDYQAYLSWLAEGNEPLPATEDKQ